MVGVPDDDEALPTAWRWGVAVTLALLLLVGGVLALRVTQPCWPWQDTASSAGGTTCDGEKARFDTD